MAMNINAEVEMHFHRAPHCTVGWKRWKGADRRWKRVKEKEKKTTKNIKANVCIRKYFEAGECMNIFITLNTYSVPWLHRKQHNDDDADNNIITMATSNNRKCTTEHDLLKTTNYIRHENSHVGYYNPNTHTNTQNFMAKVIKVV